MVTNVMNNLINQLILILQEEKKIYDSLLHISKNKTEIVVGGRINELENLIKIEQDLIVQVGKKEAGREDLMNNIIDEFKISEHEVSISTLYKYLDTENSNRVQNIQNEILKTLNELKETNKVNSRLIKQSLDYVEFSMNVFQGIKPLGNDYQNQGKIKNEKSHSKSFFDVKL